MLNLKSAAMGLALVAAASSIASAGIDINVVSEPAGSLEKFSFYVADFGGGLGGYVQAGAGITSLTGTFSVINGGTLSVPGVTAAQWRSGTTNGFIGNGINSAVNFDAFVGNAMVRNPSSSVTPISMSGAWFTTEQSLRLSTVDFDLGTTEDNGVDNTLLAIIYATPGSEFTFNGLFNLSGPLGGGLPTIVNRPITFTSVPEPVAAPIVLGAAAGLLARRRK